MLSAILAVISALLGFFAFRSYRMGKLTKAEYSAEVKRDNARKAEQQRLADNLAKIEDRKKELKGGDPSDAVRDILGRGK